MKVGAAETWVRQQLKGSYEAREAATMADMLLEKATGLVRLDRLTRKDMVLTAPQLQYVTDGCQRLQEHEPIQYITGEAWFAGLKLFVNENVLIPRPETEELAGWIISDVKASGKNVFEKNTIQADKSGELKILDMGTGSGCIALALKKGMPKADVWGCDISDDALNIARRNSSELNIRVDFIGINFLDIAQQKQLPQVDVIVSNPPYIPHLQKQAMPPNVLNFEPHTALFVPSDNAMLFYKAIAEFGKVHLNKNGAVYIEINEEFGEEVMAVFNASGYSSIELKKDMQGKDRMVKASPHPLKGSLARN